MDEGWTRWVLERYGFSFVTLRPEDFRASGRATASGAPSAVKISAPTGSSELSDKVDVVIVADDARIPIEGAPAGRGGGQAARSIRPEYGYALTAADIAGFDQFVRAGGTAVFLNNASAFAIQRFKLPVSNVVSGLRPEEFFLRGSIVEVSTATTHPVMAGMPDRAPIFADSSPVFETLDGFKGTVLATYQESGSPLLSGYLIGDRYLHGKAAALDVELDKGHVVLIGFRPQWRGQSFGTFRVLFNAALYGREPS